jgi:hypothetical protein
MIDVVSTCSSSCHVLAHVFQALEADVRSSARSIAERPRSEEHRARSLSGPHDHEHEYVARERSEAQ